jgi:hypothetical protein
MNKSRLVMSALCFAGAAITALPASAIILSARTWVSRNGTINSICDISNPCSTFQQAHDLTQPSGVINCLDSGDFGPIVITKSITIRCTAVIAGISTFAAPNNQAIQVAPGPTGVVVIDGLDLDGRGAGSFGIMVISGLKVSIANTRINRFINTGIIHQTSTAGGHVFIDDSKIVGNAVGVSAFSNSITSLTNTSVVASSVRSLQINDSATIIGVQNSIINDSPVGIYNPNGGQAISVGPSNLVTGAGSFTATIPFN